jgi:hypothetical protein
VIIEPTAHPDIPCIVFINGRVSALAVDSVGLVRDRDAVEGLVVIDLVGEV